MSSEMLLDKIRLAPEQLELKAAMDRFNLAPVISNFEQTGLRSVRDAVLATDLQISEVMCPRLFNLLHGVRSRLKFEEPVNLACMPMHRSMHPQSILMMDCHT